MQTQTALALPKVVKVNACGRLLEVTSEGASSMQILRRELVAKLRICNPASLQVTDVAGRVMHTDADLHAVVQDDKLPLQAKLTVAALHEIEQKKKEGRYMEHDMVGLQWQIVIEQVSAFSQELTSMSTSIQTAQDDARKIVKQFEDSEKLRNEQFMAIVQREMGCRQAEQNELSARVDAAASAVMEERSAREVLHYQLSKQIEQVVTELHMHFSSNSQSQAEVERSINSIRHDIKMQLQKDATNWDNYSDVIKLLDGRVKEHAATSLTHQHRLSQIEAEHKKVRSDVDLLDSGLSKHRSQSQMQIKRHGEEIERTSKEGTYSHTNELGRHVKESEALLVGLDHKLQGVREEAIRATIDLKERSKTLEDRCSALEKEHGDKWGQQVDREITLVNKVHNAKHLFETSNVERNADAADLRATISKVDMLMTRMQDAEKSLHAKVTGDHWAVQLENFAQVMQNHESKMMLMEREFNAKLHQEASMRDDVMQTLQACSVPRRQPIKDGSAEAPTTSGMARSLSPPPARSESRRNNAGFGCSPGNSIVISPNGVTSPGRHGSINGTPICPVPGMKPPVQMNRQMSVPALTMNPPVGSFPRGADSKRSMSPTYRGHF